MRQANLAPTELLIQPAIKPLSADSKTELAELGDLIKVEYLDNYSDWLKLVWSLASVNEYDLALTLSQKSDNFEQKEFDKVYNWTTIKTGTFYRYCKLSDFDRYVEIKGFAEIENNEESFAETFLKLEGDNVIYSATAKEVFVYSNTNWLRRPNDAICSKRRFEWCWASSFQTASNDLRRKR